MAGQKGAGMNRLGGSRAALPPGRNERRLVGPGSTLSLAGLGGLLVEERLFPGASRHLWAHMVWDRMSH